MEYKGYDLIRNSTGLYGIKPVGRGSVPKTLRGAYTSTKWATGAIDSYLATKEKSNVKAEGTG